MPRRLPSIDVNQANKGSQVALAYRHVEKQYGGREGLEKKDEKKYTSTAHSTTASWFWANTPSSFPYAEERETSHPGVDQFYSFTATYVDTDVALLSQSRPLHPYTKKKHKEIILSYVPSTTKKKEQEQTVKKKSHETIYTKIMRVNKYYCYGRKQKEQTDVVKFKRRRPRHPRRATGLRRAASPPRWSSAPT